MSSIATVDDTAVLQVLSALSSKMTCSATANPLTSFTHFYQPVLANTAEECNATYLLRHQVYCEELHYEALRANQLENDSFDPQSIHCAIKDLKNNELAGTVRIICTNTPSQLLPIEHYFKNQFNNTALAPSLFARDEICEISRLAVPKHIRSKQVLTTKDTDVLNLHSECQKLVSVSLYLLATLLCLREGKHHAYVVAEPSLARLLKRVGIHFVQIADSIDLNGERAPYYLDVRTTKDTLKKNYLHLMQNMEALLFEKKHPFKLNHFI